MQRESSAMTHPRNSNVATITNEEVLANLFDLRNDPDYAKLVAQGYAICCTEMGDVEKNSELRSQGYTPSMVEVWNDGEPDEKVFYHWCPKQLHDKCAEL